MGEEPYELLSDRLNDALNWLDMNDKYTKFEYDTMRKDLEEEIIPVLEKFTNKSKKSNSDSDSDSCDSFGGLEGVAKTLQKFAQDNAEATLKVKNILSEGMSSMHKKK